MEVEWTDELQGRQMEGTWLRPSGASSGVWAAAGVGSLGDQDKAVKIVLLGGAELAWENGSSSGKEENPGGIWAAGGLWH